MLGIGLNGRIKMLEREREAKRMMYQAHVFEW